MSGHPHLRKLLLSLFLVSCGAAQESEGTTRLGDSWAGEAGNPDRPTLEIPTDAPKVIFLGDSLSAGLHLEADQAFPAILQRRLSASGTPFHLVNAGVSGDTTAGGLRRIDWMLRQDPDVVVVELGANDGLRGVELAEIESNLRSLLQRIQAADVTALLLEMRIPSSYGAVYTKGFHEIYGRLSAELDVVLSSDWLEGVGGVPRHNLPDGMHPNSKGHELLADNIEAPLSKVLNGL